MNEQRILFWGAVWLVLFGVWPLAHPDHGDWSPMSMADLLFHILGATYLALRIPITRKKEQHDRTD